MIVKFKQLSNIIKFKYAAERNTSTESRVNCDIITGDLLKCVFNEFSVSASVCAAVKNVSVIYYFHVNRKHVHCRWFEHLQRMLEYLNACKMAVLYL